MKRETNTLIEFKKGFVYQKNQYGKNIFAEEYFNGERSGKGKEYNDNEDLIFEGEYLNGKNWKGKGKEYYSNGQLKFEGDYLCGKK